MMATSTSPKRPLKAPPSPGASPAGARPAPRGLALQSLSWPERLKALLRFAVLAPSEYNSQPWKVRIVDNTLELRPDRARATPVIDPDHRELAISCGAFLFHLRVAAEHFGWQTVVTLLPTPPTTTATTATTSTSTLVPAQVFARVVFADADIRASSDDNESLFQAMPARRTYRRSFLPGALAADVITVLQQAAVKEGARLVVVAGEADRLALARLIGAADEEQWKDPAFRDEFAFWCRGAGDDRRDGLPGVSLGRGEIVSQIAPMLRTFDLGSSRAARNEELAHGSPLLAVLCTDDDDEGQWLAAGEALARVLLTATAAGVGASFLNQAVEVEANRLRLGRMLEKLERPKAAPQVVLRFGRPNRALPPPTPRRPVEEILL